MPLVPAAAACGFSILEGQGGSRQHVTRLLERTVASGLKSELLRLRRGARSALAFLETTRSVWHGRDCVLYCGKMGGHFDPLVPHVHQELSLGRIGRGLKFGRAFGGSVPCILCTHDTRPRKGRPGSKCYQKNEPCKLE